jgi:hypothetical protein
MEEIGFGILIGIGLALFGRKGARPIVKGTIKAGMIASEKAEEAYHEGKEMLADLMAEARQETAEYRAAAEAAMRDDARKGPASN